MEEKPPPQIKVTGVSMVAPASPPQIHRMFLSNLDLLWLYVKTVLILFYQISPEEEYSSMVERLKRSLSSVLVHFYQLAGRLVEGESGRLEVDCNGEGVEFIEAAANIRFEDLEKEGFQNKPYFTNLASTGKPFENGNYSIPLLSIQITSFEGGNGICISVAFSHVIMDGTSLLHFWKSWGECSRGLLVSNPPLHNRRLLKMENQSPLRLSFKPHVICKDAHILKFMPDASQSEQDKIASSFGEGDRRRESIEKWQHQNQPLEISTFHFSKDVIRQLKQRTSASTSFNAVAAQFWRSMVKARNISEEEVVHFVVLADCRARVAPPLPPTFFGNCLTIGIVRTTAKRLLTEDASFAAHLVEEAINSCTEEEQIKNMIKWLESPSHYLDTVDEELARGYSTNVVGSLRFPVDEVDYGCGKPLNCQMASMREIGGMVMVGVRSEELGVPVSTCLPSDMMEKLRQILFTFQSNSSSSCIGSVHLPSKI